MRRGSRSVVVDIGDETSVSGALVRTLKNGHENIAAGAVFRDHKPHDVVSGGLDCAVCKWDQSRATPVATWRVGELVAALDAESGSLGADDDDAAASPPPMCNPPMVHAIACANGFEVSDDCAGVKRLVAAACGDGTCALIDLDLPAAKSGAGKSRNNKSGSRTSKGRSSSSSSAAAGGEAGGTSGSAGNDPVASRGGERDARRCSSVVQSAALVRKPGTRGRATRWLSRVGAGDDWCSRAGTTGTWACGTGASAAAARGAAARGLGRG